MLTNMVNLIIAFNDGSRQEEKIQSINIDIFNSDRYNLTENSLTISYVVNPPIAPEVGRFTSFQEKGDGNQV